MFGPIRITGPERDILLEELRVDPLQSLKLYGAELRLRSLVHKERHVDGARRSIRSNVTPCDLRKGSPILALLSQPLSLHLCEYLRRRSLTHYPIEHFGLATNVHAAFAFALLDDSNRPYMIERAEVRRERQLNPRFIRRLVCPR